MIRRIVDGDPEVVVKLREAGLLFPASFWEKIYGKTGTESNLGSSDNC